MSGKGSVPRSGAPSELRFWIGGFGAEEQEWTLEGETLVYRHLDPFGSPRQPGEVRVVPYPEAWRRFWEGCDRAGLGRWGDSYSDPDILDGTQWELRVVHGEFELEAFGSNAYPDREGKPHQLDSSRGFDEFVAALEELTDVEPEE